MKKLLIALASAAAITGAAKAVGSGVGYYTDFEGLTVGNAFSAAEHDLDNGGNAYWAIAEGADENYATVTNATFKDSAGAKEGSSKALAIDTSARLSRRVNTKDNDAEVPESFASTNLYFDGYVQFTAADSLPTTEAGDKLVVWLYGGDEDTDDAVTNALGLATKSTTNLVITAGVLSDGVPTRADFLVTTGAAAIAPDTWHRLTIKAFTEEIDNAQIPMFKVYLDGTQLSAGNTENFPSLVAYNSDSGDQFTLTSVSFEGTGAVDDLGFTAADLFPDAVAETFTLTVTAEGGTAAIYADEFVTSKDSPYVYGLNETTIYATFAPTSEGATITATLDGVAVFDDGNPDGGMYFYEITVPQGTAAGASLTLAFSATSGETPSQYPDYISGISDSTTKAAYESKYDEWKVANGADTGSAYRDQFLLNVAHDAKAELTTAAIVIENGAVKITTTPAADSVNGKVYIKKGTTLSAMAAAAWAEATVLGGNGDDAGKISVTPEQGDTAGFYKVKVDF